MVDNEKSLQKGKGIMKKKYRLIVCALIAVFALAVASSCTSLSGVKKRSGKGTETSREEERYDRLKDRARNAAAKEKYEKAARLFTRALEEVPNHADTAFSLAVVHARMGDFEEAMKALEEAVQRGYAADWQASEEPSFKTLREESRFHELIEEMKKNEEEQCRAIGQSKALPSIGSASPFGTFQKLNSSFDADSEKMRVTDWKLSFIDQQAGSNVLLAKKIISLQKYVQEHATASDLKDARGELVRAWKNLAGFSSHWEEEIADGLSEAIEDFRSAFPEAQENSEFEYYQIESILRGVIAPGQDCFGWEDAPSLNYEEAIPLLEKYTTVRGESPWVTRALGLKALCLYEMYPDDYERAQAAYEAFLMRPEIPDSQKLDYDYMLPIDLRPLKFLIHGAPDLAGETLDGRTLSLASLRGKVVLLDFWSPG